MCHNAADSKTGTGWSLDVLYRADDDPELWKDLKAAGRRATQFVTAHRGNIQQCAADPVRLREAIREYEAIHERTMNPYLYAYLRSAQDKRDPAREAQLERVREKCRKITFSLLFFRLELAQIPEQTLLRLAAHADLRPYAPALHHLFSWKGHLLDENGETSVWQELYPERQQLHSAYDKLFHSLRVDATPWGKSHSMSIPRLLACLRSPQKRLRDEAFRSFFKLLGDRGLDFGEIFRALLRNHREEAKRRGFRSVEQQFLLVNQVEPSVVQTMAGVVESHYPEGQEYLRLKAGLLGVERLTSSDVPAPAVSESIQLDLAEALELVIRSLGMYHPLFRSILEEFRGGKCIDGSIRPGKWPGPFCKCLAPSQHPFVSLLYQGNISDLLTLSHELGHALHYRVASAQRFLNFRPPPVLAEFSATFFEILLVQHLLSASAWPISERELLAAHMDSIMTTVFRQHVITRFERTLHGRTEPPGSEDICRRWWEENVSLYGDAVEMIPEYQWGWTSVWHIFHKPFYCSSYVFGNMLSMVMFELYREGGPHVLNDLIAIWSAGNSRAVATMLKTMGLEPSRSDFWEYGFRYIDRLLGHIKATAGQKP